MTIGKNLTEWGGFPVVAWERNMPVSAGKAYRLSLDYEESENGAHWTDLFDSFLQDPAIQQVEALLVGAWEDAYETPSTEIVEAIVAAREKLPHLTALFVGDMTYEECEISWITQSDLSPLLEAYPKLRYFGARGGNSLTLGVINHANLEQLTIETGGLDREVVQAVVASQFPNLKHLELWLGTEDYGATTTLEDLQPLFSRDLFPVLEYLGLRNSDLTDEIAIGLKNAPMLAHLKMLDLSLGILTDQGAQALLDNPALTHLEKLDLHHHYCSDAMIARLQQLPMAVDASGQEQVSIHRETIYRYVAVGE